LQAIKDFVTEVKLPNFQNISSHQLLEIIETFLEGNTVLTNLSIDLARLNSKEKIFEKFGNMKTLKALELSCWRLENREIKILADFLETNDTLTELNIAKIWYDAEGAKILLDAIQKSRFLKRLIISKSDKIYTLYAKDLGRMSQDKEFEVIYLPQ